MFHLEFHLPYFVLKEQKEGHPRQEERTTMQREWIDLSFLESGSSNSPNRESYGIYKAHFALTIQGFNNWRWTAFVFDNNHFDERFEFDLEEEEFSYDSLQEDLIVSGQDTIHDANKPTRDPRVYFLICLQSRMRRALEAWRYLIWRIQDSIEHYVRSSPDFGQKRIAYANLGWWVLPRSVMGARHKNRPEERCKNNTRLDKTSFSNSQQASTCSRVSNYQTVANIQLIQW